MTCSLPSLRRSGFALCLGALSLTSAGAAEEPWRLGEVPGVPDWLTLGGSYRVRYEALHHPFFPVDTASDRILVERLLLDGRFLREAPTASGNGDTCYLYTQADLTF